MIKTIEIPKNLDLFQKGLDAFGQSPLTFENSEVNKKSQTMYEADVPSNFIQDGDTIVRLNMIDGYLQSDGFVSGSTGWRIDSEGNVEFNNGTFRGSLSAASGTLGAITIGTNAWHVDSSGNMWWGNSETYAGATIKISSDGSINFTEGTFSGTLSSPSGTLGTITGGTIIGAAIQTSLSGYRVKLSSSGLQFYDGDTFKGQIGADSNGSLVNVSLDNHYFRDLGGELARITGNGLELPTGRKIIVGGFQGETPGAKQFATSFRVKSGQLQWRGRSETFMGGVLVDMSAESDWYDIDGATF